MNSTELIDEIVSRVSAKLSEIENPAASAKCSCCGSYDAPGLLVLTQEHGEHCHTMLESPRLKARFRTECALMQDYKVCMQDYSVVLLYGMTNETLAKLASGICDTAYTRLAQQAILAGKRIFLPREEVELFRYEQTAPPPYYEMLLSKLNLLTSSGIVICAENELEDCVLDSNAAASANKPCGCSEQSAVIIKKRVITERDVSEASAARATCIHVAERAIITDLAADYARTRGISFLRG